MCNDSDSPSLRRRTIFLYNLFAAIWLLALPLNYLAMPETNPESLEFGMDHSSRRFLMTLIVPAAGATQLVLLYALWKRVPNWFLTLMTAALGMYIVSGVWVLRALQRF